MTKEKEFLIEFFFNAIKKENMSDLSKAELEKFVSNAPDNVKSITEQIFMMGYVCGMFDEQNKKNKKYINYRV
jgi:hypothetical protein